MDDIPLTITGTLHVTTVASVWLIRTDSYVRLPRSEARRPRLWSIDGALDDGAWTDHDGVWLDLVRLRLRVLPSGRRPGSVGIFTGTVVAVAGADSAVTG